MTADLDASPLPPLPARPIDGHKGTFGTVAVVGGCDDPSARMIGAPALAARAALRAGCGLVRVVSPATILSHVLMLEPSATGVSIPVDVVGAIEPSDATEVIDRVTAACDCIAVGPGLGTSACAIACALRAVQQEDVPAVVDADAINALAAVPEMQLDVRANAVFTPHPGEFARLAANLRIKADPAHPESRVDAAARLAQRLGAIVVLKGHRTVVSDGLRAWTCQRGHPCLATAGTGDVLTGLLASLIAQHARTTLAAPAIPQSVLAKMPESARQRAMADVGLSLYDAARLAVEIHAIAGERWAQAHRAQGGMLARELSDRLAESVNDLRTRPAE
ncbi:MAG: NAD(P)H-hydrate dehydratase [Phycisphaeraceae bacterium]|nr:NAD(P)H-hydrate dehydratase [Phycisphaeraceae bacterium]